MITSNTVSNCSLNSYRKWDIGADIREILMADTAITAEVGSKIFPLVAPEDTEGNFIIYERSKYTKKKVKMGVYEDEIFLALTVISDNYDSAVRIASLLDDALIGYHLIPNGVEPPYKVNIDLEDSTEAFEDFKYYETLILRVY